MATTINADTITGGAIVTGDASGTLNLQSGGNTLVSLSGATVNIPAGLAVDSASVTGGISAASASITGSLTAGALTFPTSDGTSGQALITNGSGTLSFTDLASGYTVCDCKYVNTCFSIDFSCANYYQVRASQPICISSFSNESSVTEFALDVLLTDQGSLDLPTNVNMNNDKSLYNTHSIINFTKVGSDWYENSRSEICTYTGDTAYSKYAGCCFTCTSGTANTLSFCGVQKRDGTRPAERCGVFFSGCCQNSPLCFAYNENTSLYDIDPVCCALNCGRVPFNAHGSKSKYVYSGIAVLCKDDGKRVTIMPQMFSTSKQILGNGYFLLEHNDETAVVCSDVRYPLENNFGPGACCQCVGSPTRYFASVGYSKKKDVFITVASSANGGDTAEFHVFSYNSIVNGTPKLLQRIDAGEQTNRICNSQFNCYAGNMIHVNHMDMDLHNMPAMVVGYNRSCSCCFLATHKFWVNPNDDDFDACPVCYYCSYDLGTSPCCSYMCWCGGLFGANRLNKCEHKFLSSSDGGRYLASINSQLFGINIWEETCRESCTTSCWVNRYCDNPSGFFEYCESEITPNAYWTPDFCHVGFFGTQCSGNFCSKSRIVTKTGANTWTDTWCCTNGTVAIFSCHCFTPLYFANNCTCFITPNNPCDDGRGLCYDSDNTTWCINNSTDPGATCACKNFECYAAKCFVRNGQGDERILFQGGAFGINNTFYPTYGGLRVLSDACLCDI